MIEKKPLRPHRIRKINGSFAFIEHRFLRNGFFESLSHHELLLYFFLVLVSDRGGLSYYGYGKIRALIGITIDEYIRARDGLIEKDLIAFDGILFQVLALPPYPENRTSAKPALPLERKRGEGPLHIKEILGRCAREIAHD